MLSIITLYFISYLIFIFPFDVLSTWLGNPTSLLEVFIITTLVFSLCLYYFRSKSTNKFIKIFVYEGFGIGTVSFFLILPLIAFEYLKIVSSYKLAIFFFFIQIPTIIYGYINSKKTKIKNLSLNSELVEKSFKFVFISDVHIGSNHPSSLKKIVSEIIKLDPSFLIIGGDLIDSSSFKIEDLKEFKKLNKPIYFVTGNHEYYIKNSKKHLDDLDSVGIQTLNNESLKINGINLIGLSDNILSLIHI